MRVHIILLVLLGMAEIIFGWRSFKVVFTSFPIEVNKDFVEVKIEIQNNTGETTVDCHVNVIEQMDDISLMFTISLETSEGNYTTLVNRTVNFCKFLKTKSIDPVMRVLYEDLLKHGNFFKSCPIKKGIYYLHDYRIDEEILPTYVPEANLCVDILMTLPNISTPIFKGQLNGKIDKSKGFNNLKMFSLG